MSQTENLLGMQFKVFLRSKTDLQQLLKSCSSLGELSEITLELNKKDRKITFEALNPTHTNMIRGELEISRLEIEEDIKIAFNISDMLKILSKFNSHEDLVLENFDTNHMTVNDNKIELKKPNSRMLGVPKFEFNTTFKFDSYDQFKTLIKINEIAEIGYKEKILISSDKEKESIKISLDSSGFGMIEATTRHIADSRVIKESSSGMYMSSLLNPFLKSINNMVYKDGLEVNFGYTTDKPLMITVRTHSGLVLEYFQAPFIKS